MDMEKRIGGNLPPQELRNSSDRRGGIIVPDTPLSTSHDGPNCALSTSVRGENVIAENSGRASTAALAPAKLRRERVTRSPSISSVDMEEVEEISDSSVTESQGSQTSKDELLTRRKRGRPPAHGDYVGLAEQRKKIKSARVLLERLDSGKDLTKQTVNMDLDSDPTPTGRRPIVKAITIADLALKSPEEIRQCSCDAAEKIIMMVTKSSNLKGGFIKDLKEQARLQEAAAIELSRRVAMEDSDRISQMEEKVAKLAAILESKNAEIRRLNRRIEEIGGRRENVPNLPAASKKKKRQSSGRKNPNTSDSSEERDLPNMGKIKKMILNEFANLRRELLGPVTLLEKNRTLAQVVAGHSGTARMAPEKRKENVKKGNNEDANKRKNEGANKNKTLMQERMERALMHPPPPPCRGT